VTSSFCLRSGDVARASLTARVCLVTGATGGIGRATVEALADRGGLVVATGRDEGALAQLGRLERVEALPGDLADVHAVSLLAERALAVHGRIDVLVNVAGAGLYGPVAALDTDELERVVRVNVTAPIVLTRALLPQMLERGSGQLVNVGSVVGHVGHRHEAAYAATKAALAVFSESLRSELQGTGVSVSLVSPGVVETRFFERRGAPYDRRRPKPIAPELVAAAIVEALERGRADVLVPGWLALPVRLRGAAPGLYRALARRFD
jgi:short-subunit dehydrogenase